MTKNIILADQQDLSKAGILYFLTKMKKEYTIQEAESKKELMQLLAEKPDSIVLLDYTGLDFTGQEDLSVIGFRFKKAFWILFSEDLSTDFLKYFTGNFVNYSIVFKDSRKEEISLSLDMAFKQERYICSRAGIQMLSKAVAPESSDKLLTSSEREVLKLIAMGKTTKEIASERFSSIHTITTHRKNIFRKLEVNSLHEATKYALRAGIIDSAEYYI